MAQTLTEEDILDRIDLWHEDTSTDLELHDYLGWTWEEFVAWVRDSTMIPSGPPEE